jgi:hypothetical protein
VAHDDFPANVGRYITEHVDSVAQLEVLLLLRSDAARSWTAADVSSALRLTRETAEQQLRLLTDHGIAVAADADCVRYAPQTTQLAEVLDGLAMVYEQRRVTVITMIYSKPVEKVRTFADAFRLRKES